MDDILNINNGESGLSVRNKLNSIIDQTNHAVYWESTSQNAQLFGKYDKFSQHFALNLIFDTTTFNYTTQQFYTLFPSSLDGAYVFFDKAQTTLLYCPSPVNFSYYSIQIPKFYDNNSTLALSTFGSAAGDSFIVENTSNEGSIYLSGADKLPTADNVILISNFESPKTCTLHIHLSGILKKQF